MMSGTVMALAGAAALVFGSHLFTALCAAAAGLMIWEIANLSAPEISNRLAMAVAAAAAAVSMAAAYPDVDIPYAGLHVVAAPAVLALFLPTGRIGFVIAGSAVMLAVSVLTDVRQNIGIAVVIWLILTVIATDVAGYFAGRAIGGPKLSPNTSPNKTWSGAAAGWLAAGAVGLLCVDLLGSAALWAGLAVAVAAQAGDWAESWLKRRAGVKDSSRLIPGHGGFCDRFDGMVGGCCAYWILQETELLQIGMLQQLP